MPKFGSVELLQRFLSNRGGDGGRLTLEELWLKRRALHGGAYEACAGGDGECPDIQHFLGIAEWHESQCLTRIGDLWASTKHTTY
ncbi:Protein of unknown function [Pyronema omphalodes CBS 100304]|uniref:Uncharacterized protein n=1 Tax=Pyronema omphalodes (strain CBS 100304) TaxID=1076935 RepID=U4L293_PYROM|nr:Protein of unknown function [Pyronema omphalodes CBS 100304]